MFCQEAGDVVWGHINGTLASNSGGVTVSSFATFGSVRYFLATDAGLMSFDLAIETFVFVHELFLLSIGMHLSHSSSINVHGMSSLEGGA